MAHVQRTLDDRIVHPTPYYETQITMVKVPEGKVIHDRGVIYGPWLEGTGERNKTTSFKGYHAFELARRDLEVNMMGYVDAATHLFIERLNS
jgi:hypothetical protein